MTTIHATRMGPPPGWAVRQRHLIARMNEAAPVFQERMWKDAPRNLPGFVH